MDMKESENRIYSMKEDDYIMRLPEVVRKIGVARSTLYKMVSDGNFPRPIHLSARSVGWIASEVTDWLHQKIAQRSA